jgi:hypothetical protein
MVITECQHPCIMATHETYAKPIEPLNPGNCDMLVGRRARKLQVRTGLT